MKRALVFLLLASCSGTVILPDVAGTQSVLLLVEGSSPRVEAHDYAAAPRRISADGADALTALLYVEPLDQLGLIEGELAPYVGPGGRELPTADHGFRHVEEDSWRPLVEGESALLTSFRLPPDTPKSCPLRGGCYPGATGECVAPCPAPMGVSLPALPSAILPELLPCPSGWREIERAGIQACEPRDPVACGVGLEPFLGSDCAPIAPACAADGWPAEPLGRTVLYVRAGGTGPGTRDLPLGSIGAALAISSAGSVIALAPGRYDEAIQLDGARELLGACTNVVLGGAISIADGSLSTLRVEGALVIRAQAALSSLDVRGSIEVRPGAHLVATRVVARGAATSLHVVSAGVDVRSSILGGPVAVALTTATATIASTSFQGETRASGSRIRLEDSLLAATPTVLTATAGTQVIGDRLVLLGQSAAPLVLVSSGAALTLTRTRAELTEGVGLRLESPTASAIEHCLIAYAPGADEGAAIESRTGLNVARRVLTDGAPTAFFIVSSNLLVTESTLRGGVTAVRGADGAELRVELSRIEDTTGFAIVMSGMLNRPGDSFQLADLELVEVGGGLHTTRDQTGRLERLLVRDASGPALKSGGDGSAPLLFAEDLSFERAGIELLAGSLDLAGFVIEDAPAVGVHIVEAASAKLRHGRIARSPVGIALEGTGRDGREVLDYVRFEDVPSPCAPCGD